MRERASSVGKIGTPNSGARPDLKLPKRRRNNDAPKPTKICEQLQGKYSEVICRLMASIGYSGILIFLVQLQNLIWLICKTRIELCCQKV